LTRSTPLESLTARVVAELAPHVPPLSCCRAALVAGMADASTGDRLVLTTTRAIAARAAMATLHAAGVDAHVGRHHAARRGRYLVTAARVLTGETGQQCCARSRLRGAFLAAGSVSRPQSAPHLEVRCCNRDAAESLLGALALLEIPAQIVERRGAQLVMVRTAAGVGDALSVIGAQAGRLQFEEGRVMAEVRSGINRRINAETANLRRTVGAGVRQLEAIAVLREDGRWEGVSPALREAGELRLRHPDAPLEALAGLAACSRSAMGGRLHRLVAMAGDGPEGAAGTLDRGWESATGA
jgi:hypothetical protein